MLEHFWILVLDLDLAMVAFLKKGGFQEDDIKAKLKSIRCCSWYKAYALLLSY